MILSLGATPSHEEEELKKDDIADRDDEQKYSGEEKDVHSSHSSVHEEKIEAETSEKIAASPVQERVSPGLVRQQVVEETFEQVTAEVRDAAPIPSQPKFEETPEIHIQAQEQEEEQPQEEEEQPQELEVAVQQQQVQEQQAEPESEDEQEHEPEVTRDESDAGEDVVDATKSTDETEEVSHDVDMTMSKDSSQEPIVRKKSSSSSSSSSSSDDEQGDPGKEAAEAVRVAAKADSSSESESEQPQEQDQEDSSEPSSRPKDYSTTTEDEVQLTKSSMDQAVVGGRQGTLEEEPEVPEDEPEPEPQKEPEPEVEASSDIQIQIQHATELVVDADDAIHFDQTGEEGELQEVQEDQGLQEAVDDEHKEPEVVQDDDDQVKAEPEVTTTKELTKTPPPSPDAEAAEAEGIVSPGKKPVPCKGSFICSPSQTL